MNEALQISGAASLSSCLLAWRCRLVLQQACESQYNADGHLRRDESRADVHELFERVACLGCISGLDPHERERGKEVAAPLDELMHALAGQGTHHRRREAPHAAPHVRQGTRVRQQHDGSKHEVKHAD